MTSDTPAASPDDASLADTQAALLEAERAALDERRRIVLGDEAAAGQPGELGLPRVGLALSGGGVRSATFAIGLMRGMAQSRVDERPPGETDPARRTLASGGLLGRLDYLSTVSGGGYAGGMFGRLVSTYGLAGAQALMAGSDSPVLAWLRRNGRYLTPSGSRDLGIAVVTYLRAWLAIHTEFLFASMALALLVMAPHLAQHSTQWLDPRGWEAWRTLWWAMAALFWLAVAPALITAYWAGRDAPDPAVVRRGPPWRDLAFQLVLFMIVYGVLGCLHRGDALDMRRGGLTWPCAAALALTSGVVGQALAHLWLALLSGEPHALKVARLRNHMTRALRAVSIAALAIATLGALDGASWWILEELQSGNGWLWSGVGAGGLALLAMRGTVQPLQQIAAKAEAHARECLPRLLDLAGLIGLAALVLAWLVVMQWFVFAPRTFADLDDVPALMRAGLIFVVWLAWVLFTASNEQMANTSSLHSFYRARLVRAYLAVGNRKRVLTGAARTAGNVTVVVDGDDASLEHYRPEACGGPIHLVNTCLNQTRDDRSGLYNADRKGTMVTATWRGVEVGSRDFIARRPGQDAGTLGRWVAVSGAAASPGAGSYTSRGLALLVYFLGVRLGYWIRSPRAASPALRWLSDFGWRRCPKPLMLASEASATFFGTDRPWWYLSDGGHFENTAVYALLKRELDFIFLSDASCDAGYAFGDIENLVRKARIDLGAEIDFYTREEAARLFTLAGRDLTVLSPEEMADNHSCRGVLLARIRYRERPGPRGPFRPEGTLLVIKPNLHDALDVDVLAYAQQHTGFPHESTGDQSFDEAQWESYHRLGEDFGRALHDTWLAQLPGWRGPARHGIRVAARLGGSPGDAARAGSEPLWRRTVRATAIGTTLGLGASGTLLLSLWQAQAQFERNRTDQQTEARQLITEVSKGLENFDGACPVVSEGVVTQLSLLLDLRGSEALRPLETAGMERLATRITEECGKPVTPSEACMAGQRRMHRDLCSLVQKPPTQDTALNYWHPGSSPDEQDRAASQVWSRLTLPWPRFGPAHHDVVVGTDTAKLKPPSALAPGRAPLPPPARGAAVPFTLGACQRAQGAVTLYVQVYDEASRLVADALRQRVQGRADETGLALQVAPVENVARTAQIRQQRRPVSWAQPTFVLHDKDEASCAWALARLLGEPWVVAGEVTTQVWVRELPGALKARPGVIELWLPPVGTRAAMGP